MLSTAYDIYARDSAELLIYAEDIVKQVNDIINTRTYNTDEMESWNKYFKNDITFEPQNIIYPIVRIKQTRATLLDIFLSTANPFYEYVRIPLAIIALSQCESINDFKKTTEYYSVDKKYWNVLPAYIEHGHFGNLVTENTENIERRLVEKQTKLMTNIRQSIADNDKINVLWKWYLSNTPQQQSLDISSFITKAITNQNEQEEPMEI